MRKRFISSFSYLLSGKEVLCSCSVLGTEEILLYFKIGKTDVDIRMKSSSENLNQFVVKFLSTSI